MRQVGPRFPRVLRDTRSFPADKILSLFSVLPHILNGFNFVFFLVLVLLLNSLTLSRGCGTFRFLPLVHLEDEMM